MRMQLLVLPERVLRRRVRLRKLHLLPKMKSLTIGEVARQAGVGVETVRFYERQGILKRPPRSASGYRQFEPEVVARIRFVRRAKELGFTLSEIKELLSLRVDLKANCAEVCRRADRKAAEIESKIRELRRMQRALKRLTAQCDNRDDNTTCTMNAKSINRKTAKRVSLAYVLSSSFTSVQVLMLERRPTSLLMPETKICIGSGAR